MTHKQIVQAILLFYAVLLIGATALPWMLMGAPGPFWWSWLGPGLLSFLMLGGAWSMIYEALWGIGEDEIED